jgi:hypothetical protein
MAFSQSLGIVPLFTAMSNNRARYGFMASPPTFSILPETQSSPTDVFLRLLTFS